MNITATEEFSEYAPTRAEKTTNSTRTGFDLTKLRLEHPDAAKESEQAERVMLPAMTRDGVHEPDQGEKDNGIDKLKDDGRQEQEELHKKMRSDAAVHYVPVRGH